jgi:hypothetical protein
MQVSDLLIGLLAFVATAVTCLSFMNTMYDVNDPKSYQVDLTANNYTAVLSTSSNLSASLASTQSLTRSSTDDIYNKMAGEPGSVASGSTASTSSDAWVSAGLTLANLGTYFKATIGLIGASATAIGISEESAPMVFIITAIILSVALTLIGIVFFRPI